MFSGLSERRQKKQAESSHIQGGCGGMFFIDTLCTSVAPFMVTSASCTCVREQGTGSGFTDVLACVFEVW